jgi:adenylate cyclase
MRRGSIAMRLLAAFLIVSLLPIGVLALLSWQESRGGADVHVEEGEVVGEESGEEVFGLPIATVELAVAGAGLALSVFMAFYISRTLVRPIRELEHAMSRVEAGELDAKARVMSNDEIGRLAGSFNQMVDGLRREAFIRDLFGQYVTPELAEAAIERRAQLDGQLVTCTVLFADIRDFTGIAEKVPASALIEMLNRYFDRMSAIVVREGGLVNKFGGDSLLAVFGTPLNPAPDHAARAVRAALSMETDVAAFNRDQEQAFLPEIMIGIGIATGDVVAGNVGSEKKLEYTVVGDAVNVASRLQALTKELDRSVLANGEAARGASGAARFRNVGEIAVRGKTHGVQALAVEAAVSPGREGGKDLESQAKRSYEAGS